MAKKDLELTRGPRVKKTGVVYTPRHWKELTHPALHHLSDADFTRRSGIWHRFFFRVAEADWINWYGGMKRTWPGGDGGNGAYMTDALAAAWKDRTVMPGVEVGPS